MFDVTVAPVVALRFVAGLQLYVDAPEAVIEVDEPLQIAAETGVTVRTGNGLTVMVWLAVPTQPAPLVPVMV